MRWRGEWQLTQPILACTDNPMDRRAWGWGWGAVSALSRKSGGRHARHAERTWCALSLEISVGGLPQAQVVNTGLYFQLMVASPDPNWSLQ